MPTMTMTKPATDDHLALFLSFVEVLVDRFGLAPDVARRLKLVVEEATTNVVRHAYALGAEGDLTLVADVENHPAVVAVDADGPRTRVLGVRVRLEVNALARPQLLRRELAERLGKLGDLRLRGLRELTNLAEEVT